MKQKAFLVSLFIMAVFAFFSCDSLWEHENKENVEISFSVSKSALEELFASDSMKTVSHKASVSENSVLRSINFGNNGIEMAISLHNASGNGVIATKTQVVHKDEIVRFENLMVVGSTVYAKIVLVQNGVTKEGRSETVKAVAGKNVLTVENFIGIHVSIPMVQITGGTFTMGNDSSASNDEKPTREVTLNNFYLGETEVTQAQWLAIMKTWKADAPISSVGLGDNYPAYLVSWEDAIEFCNMLSAQEGLSPYYNADGDIIDKEGTGYRLPTEAEWEYAAGGGEKNRTTYAGTSEGGNAPNVDDLGDYAWYSENNDKYGIKPVKGKKPNTLGLYDMSGNVFEWCYDLYESGYYETANDNNYNDNPTGPDLTPLSDSNRVIRGGSWQNSAIDAGVVAREKNFSGDRSSANIGFRVARNAN